MSGGRDVVKVECIDIYIHIYIQGDRKILPDCGQDIL